MKLGFEIAESVHASAPASLTVSAMGSLAAHLVIGAALVWNLSSAAGGGGVEYDAISVEMVDGRALDALLNQAARREEAGATASVAETEGAALPLETASAESAAAKAKPELPFEKRPDEQKEAAILETGSLPAAPAPVAEDESSPEKVSKEKKQPDPASMPMPSAASGGVSSQANAANASPVPAQAGASPGEVDRYSGTVSRTVQGLLRKLASSKHRGLVRLQFVVGEKGEVVDVLVKESSGDAALDTLASRLLRQASFPEPPARMTEAQRTYLVPVRVR